MFRAYLFTDPAFIAHAAININMYFPILFLDGRTADPQTYVAVIANTGVYLPLVLTPLVFNSAITSDDHNR